MSLAADDPQAQVRNAALLQGLQELGWTVGRNVRIDFRWGAGNAERIRRDAAELVALAPDVLLAPGHGPGSTPCAGAGVSPKLPYGWIDAPPSLNRLMGVRWLARLLFPGRFVGDIRDATRDFYHQFYQVDLSGAVLDALLANPPEKR